MNAQGYHLQHFIGGIWCNTIPPQGENKTEGKLDESYIHRVKIDSLLLITMDIWIKYAR
jgi:hypothetical protein